ncbi:MAG: type VI secretion system baseplate subunit TssG [Lentisphaeraceae bacterium]|nr:type VI secretion system baseplate subunit TssG [Lentisphaeraceae bacterium]
MGGSDRTAEDTISLTQEALFSDKVWEWDFFQAARFIECTNLDKPRIGEAKRTREEYISFGQKASLKFSASTVEKFEGSEDFSDWLYVNFLGLLGAQGPLPLSFTSLAHERARNHHDKTLESFLNVFNHRMISLFYRAWANAQPTVSYDRPENDRYSKYISSFYGKGLPSMKGRDALPDIAKLYYSGHLSRYTANSSGLRLMLSDYFEVPVDIDEFVGQWVDIPEENKCRLGESPDTGLMGSTMVIGSRVWECQSKFRIICGPLSYEDYQRLLPENQSIERLKDFIRNYIGLELSWELQLILKKEEVPAMQLGKSGQLGWNTWGGQEQHEIDADDLVLGPF